MRYIVLAGLMVILVIVGMTITEKVSRANELAVFTEKCKADDETNLVLYVRRVGTYCVRANGVVMRSE